MRWEMKDTEVDIDNFLVLKHFSASEDELVFDKALAEILIKGLGLKLKPDEDLDTILEYCYKNRLNGKRPKTFAEWLKTIDKKDYFTEV